MSSTTITFIGDVMLSRLIGRKYSQEPYDVVDKDVVARAKESDLIVANLESPAPSNIKQDQNHQHFIGNADILDRLQWVDLFSLSNNHINDSGEEGISETIQNLEKRGFKHNGIFTSQYEPYIYGNGSQRIAIVTLTDMLNVPFEPKSKWNTLRMSNSDEVHNVIKKCKEQGLFTIVYAHVGMLFTRFPNPATYDFLHSCIDKGADLIITAHSHCLGGMEMYNGKYIFHSIGDFVMDGSSYRRRQSCLLKICIDDNNSVSYEIIPTVINETLTTQLAPKPEKLLKSFFSVSKMIEKHRDNYTRFYSRQYKKEIIYHSFSTISFLYHTRGIKGLFKLLRQRSDEVARTVRWASSDRSKVVNDQDTLDPNRKIHSTDELYN